MASSNSCHLVRRQSIETPSAHHGVAQGISAHIILLSVAFVNFGGVAVNTGAEFHIADQLVCDGPVCWN